MTSLACQRLGQTDSLLILRLQNCNLEARPIRPNVHPNYNVSGLLNEDGMLRAGQQVVPGSLEIIDVANDWLTLADMGGARVYATMDWHPKDHCSFCEINGEGIPAGSWCVSGIETVGLAFSKERRCRDSLSQRSFEHNAYIQWPKHCIAGTHGARFDPYLQLPAQVCSVQVWWV